MIDVPRVRHSQFGAGLVDDLQHRLHVQRTRVESDVQHVEVKFGIFVVGVDGVFDDGGSGLGVICDQTGKGQKLEFVLKVNTLNTEVC